MRKQRAFIDIHVLQTVPPSCVNRDDTGSPKTAVYGGAVRSRVSSQSWKRAMRLYFMDQLGDENVGQRTKRIVDMVREQIEARVSVPDAEALAIKALTTAGLKIKDAKKGTDALFFMSHKQAGNLASAAIDDPACKDKDKFCQALKCDPSMDMVLFGRMVADDPSLNYDAASQVAHAISTHEVRNEYDYFTAVDDRKENDESGAAHLDTNEFNSSTLYRYATVNALELDKNLPGDAASVVREFVEAFVRSMPTGKQNSYANTTPVSDVYVTIRGDQPVNLVGAFEKPVSAGHGNGYLAGSRKALADYANRVYALGFADAPVKAMCVGDMADALGAENVTLNQLFDGVEEWVRAHVKDGGVV